ncbi:MAG: DinB family protein, partial [Thermoanaerobaculia bacterium]
FDSVIRDAHLERFAGWSVDALLGRFAELRHANMVELERWALTSEQLGLAGKHPSFGRVTLAQLLAAWCVHDLTHVAQIVRVMARQYDAAVGPWKQYLSILHWK